MTHETRFKLAVKMALADIEAGRISVTTGPAALNDEVFKKVFMAQAKLHYATLRELSLEISS